MTGLVVVDTPTYWSSFGQVVIIGSIQVGGIGIMTLASLLVPARARRLGLRTRLIAQAEGGARARRRPPARLRVVMLSLLFEASRRSVLTLRSGSPTTFARLGASSYGVFHSISAFNNAGFALWSDSLVQFVTDGWISLTVTRRSSRAASASPSGSSCAGASSGRALDAAHEADADADRLLLVLGGRRRAGVRVVELGDARPLGTGKLLASFFQGVTPRTAGFNTIDYGGRPAGDALRHRHPHVRRRRQRVDRGRHQGDDVRAALADGLVGGARRSPRHRLLTPRARPRPAAGVRIAFIATVAVAVGTLALMAVSDTLR